jgi:hypothetical protein
VRGKKAGVWNDVAVDKRVRRRNGRKEVGMIIGLDRFVWGRYREGRGRGGWDWVGLGIDDQRVLCRRLEKGECAEADRGVQKTI